MTAAPSRSRGPSGTSSPPRVATPARRSSAVKRAPAAPRSKSRRSKPRAGICRQAWWPSAAARGPRALAKLEPEELLAHQHEGAGRNGALLAEPQEGSVRGAEVAEEHLVVAQRDSRVGPRDVTVLREKDVAALSPQHDGFAKKREGRAVHVAPHDDGKPSPEARIGRPHHIGTV